MLRVPLVTILAREMRLKIFWSRPSFGDVASAASHDIGARNAIEIFRSRPTFGDVASAASHNFGARNAIEIFSSRPSFGDVASGASHDIGARNAIESFFNYIWCQTANNVTSRARKIFLKFVEKMYMSIFNRIYRANIVTSGPRSTSKACFVKKNFNRISRANFVICGTRTTQSQRIACFNRIPRTNIVTKASLLAIACKARLMQSPLRWHSRQAIVDIMRLSLFAIPWVAIFTRRFLFLCDWVHSHRQESPFSLASAIVMRW